MTPEPTLPPAPAPIENDGIRAPWVVGVAIATLLVMACGVGLAWEIARSADLRASSRWGAPPADVQAIEMGLLPASGSARAKGGSRATAARQASLFSDQRRSNTSARAQLSTYGWTDRAHGTVHIPLARALELYVEREGSRSGAAASAAERAPKEQR
jgi:hypothetical protein